MLRVEKLIVAPLPALSFEVAAGECFAIEGRSGSGKTRILRAIADLDAAPGDVRLEGRRREEMTAPQWRRLVRFVSADFGWWAPTVVDHAPGGTAGQKFRRLLAELDIDAATSARPIDQLSTGERRRAALALSLADDPRCILLDEPASGLDTARIALVDELIRYQMLAGRAVILVSHDQGQIDRLAVNRLQLTAGPRTAVADGQRVPTADDGVWTQR